MKKLNLVFPSTHAQSFVKFSHLDLKKSSTLLSTFQRILSPLKSNFVICSEDNYPLLKDITANSQHFVISPNRGKQGQSQEVFQTIEEAFKALERFDGNKFLIDDGELINQLHEKDVQLEKVFQARLFSEAKEGEAIDKRLLNQMQ